MNGEDLFVYLYRWLRLSLNIYLHILPAQRKSELPPLPRLPSILSLSLSTPLPACPRLPFTLSLSLSLLCSHQFVTDAPLHHRRSSSSQGIPSPFSVLISFWIRFSVNQSVDLVCVGQLIEFEFDDFSNPWLFSHTQCAKFCKACSSPVCSSPVFSEVSSLILLFIKQFSGKFSENKIDRDSHLLIKKKTRISRSRGSCLTFNFLGFELQYLVRWFWIRRYRRINKTGLPQ
ncbi:unnamed protein product [Camellia sinensis]